MFIPFWVRYVVHGDSNEDLIKFNVEKRFEFNNESTVLAFQQILALYLQDLT